jgi:hypothetical protein
MPPQSGATPCWPTASRDCQRQVHLANIQVLLRHESLDTTMIYAQVARKGPAGVASLLDLLKDWQREDVDAAVAATRERVGPPHRMKSGSR